MLKLNALGNRLELNDPDTCIISGAYNGFGRSAFNGYRYQFNDSFQQRHYIGSDLILNRNFDHLTSAANDVRSLTISTAQEYYGETKLYVLFSNGS